MMESNDPENPAADKMINADSMSKLFNYTYITLIMMSIIISLTTPVDKGINYFYALTIIFGILLVITMSGIIITLIDTGIWEDKLVWDPEAEIFVKTGVE